MVAVQQQAEIEAKQLAQTKAEADSRTPTQADAQAAESKSFDIAIREMELRHPEFDPNHPRYSQKLVDEAIARMKAYVQQGNSRSNALKLAVSDMERKEAPTQTQASQNTSPPVFVTLETFTVTLQADESGEHYLQVGIDLKVTDPTVVELAKLHMPEIRNGVLTLLSSKSAAQIAGLEGKQKLSAEIQEQVNKPLNAQVTGKGVMGVFFTSFVIQ